MKVKNPQQRLKMFEELRDIMYGAAADRLRTAEELAAFVDQEVEAYCRRYQRQQPAFIAYFREQWQQRSGAGVEMAHMWCGSCSIDGALLPAGLDVHGHCQWQGGLGGRAHGKGFTIAELISCLLRDQHLMAGQRSCRLHASLAHADMIL